MNRYHLLHATEFRYDGPVSESYNEVRLRPIHDETQSCLSFRLVTDPVSRGTSYRDAFGNWVHQFNILPEHHHLKIEAESVVLAHDALLLPPNNMKLSDLDGLRENLLSHGAGVCQDFAHILLGVVRKRGLPARYLSGYLVPESAASPDAKLQEVIGGYASHAWAEVYLPDTGWIGLDPTLGKPLGLQHVRVAYGRDYGDVAPVRGVYKGHAEQRLSVDVHVRPALDDDGREQLSENKVTPPESPAITERVQQPAQQQQQ